MAAEIELRTYVVSYAGLRLEGLFSGLSITDALHESWEPKASVTRYGRRWHLARIASEDPDFIFGRIGFVSQRELSTLFFDPDQQDFVRGGASSGVVVPLAINKHNGLVVYQLRPGVVRETSFTGALQALLNASSRTYLWSVQPQAVASTFDEWRRQVDLVTGFQFRLDKPNPHYWDSEAIEEAIEGIHLEWLRLAGNAEAGQSVDTDADLFRQALDHVLRDYGRGVVRGVDADRTESAWVKVKGLIGSVISKRRIEAVGDEEAPEDVLRQAHLQVPTNMAPADMTDLDDEPA